MREGAPFALGPPRPLPHVCGGLLCFGTTEAPAAWARGPVPLSDYRDPRRMGGWASSVSGPPRPRRMGVGTSCTLGPPRPPPHVHGGLFRFGTIGAPTARAGEPLPFWDHRSPRRVDEGALSVFEPPRALPHGQVAVFCFVTTEAPAVWAGGPLQFWDH